MPRRAARRRGRRPGSATSAARRRSSRAPAPAPTGRDAPERPTDVGDRRIVTALFADLVDYVRHRRRARSRGGPARGSTRRSPRWPRRSSASTGRARSSSATPCSRSSAGRIAHDDDAVRAPLAALAIRATLRDAGRRRRAARGPDRDRDRRGRRRPRGTTDRGDLAADRARRSRPPRGSRRSPSPARSCSTRRPSAAARERLVVEDRGSVVLRGQSRPVRLYALPGEAAWTSSRARPQPIGAARRPRRRDRPSSARRSSGPGDRAAARSCSSSGEAGIGKSRLLADLEPEARGRGLSPGPGSTTSPTAAASRTGSPGSSPRPSPTSTASTPAAFARQLLFTPDVDPADDPSLRRRDRGDRPRRGLLRLGGRGGGSCPTDPAETAAALVEVATAYVDRPDRADGPRVDRRRRPPLARPVERRDGRAARRDRRPSVPWSSSRRCARATRRPGPTQPHVERLSLDGLDAAGDGAARDDRRAGRPRRRRRPADPRADGGQPAVHRRDGPGVHRGRDARAARRPDDARSSAGPPRLPLTLRALLGAASTA